MVLPDSHSVMETDAPMTHHAGSGHHGGVDLVAKIPCRHTFWQHIVSSLHTAGIVSRLFCREGLGDDQATEKITLIGFELNLREDPID